MHRPVLGLVLASALSSGCGTAPAKSWSAPPLVVGQRDAEAPAVAPVSAKRPPSEAIAKRWPFGETTKLAAYADFRGLLDTELFRGLVPAVLDTVGKSISAAQDDCVQTLLADVREVGIGADEAGWVAIARFDEKSKPMPPLCIAAMGGSLPGQDDGGHTYYPLQSFVLVAEHEFVFIGSKPLVTKALEGASGAMPSSLRLGKDEYVSWMVTSPEDGLKAHGALFASSEKFRFDVAAETSDERLAQMIEEQLGSGVDRLPALGGEEGATLGRLARAIQVKRDGARLSLAFELRGSPRQQAHDLGAAFALANASVRTYIANAKVAEVRNTLGQIAKDCVAHWEMEDPRGPHAKKKLTSFPAVPATVPRGVKVQSKEADWKAWQPLRFTMSGPQYFQYEIKAAKNGESAEILGRGDLNGDGKTSLFRITLKVDRKKNQLLVSPAIDEKDPME